ncbi:hypothetical protein OQY15_03435 [Pedobacter sp. MC2016-15]|jgi:hypothetical protein|uniref:hypothetical protein n=1 Tax=Pedobacter sp. MC2016-15 TaxID=2994473 RepID=UPI0022457663|nr:hypothetical protein [Pedobacter sp. MC2016-15]MCX2478127.1 hypothetical protein [Pedobacter sp. MC2016-15]
MKLCFDTKFGPHSNYFLEKIWKGLLDGPGNLDHSYFTYLERYIARYGEGWEGEKFSEFLEPKLHTIRRDPENKWVAGMDIQPVININTSDEFQFAPTLKCQSVQRIQIDYSGMINPFGPAIFIDYQLLDHASLSRMVRNDGFPTVKDFLYYFNEDFTGNMIHWTPMIYE